MKLRKHRREAKALAEDVTVNRKAAAKKNTGNVEGQGASPLTRKVRTGSRPAFRFRVEFWKLDPEVRIGHGEVELCEGDTARDLAWHLGERLHDWMMTRVPKAPDIWDTPIKEYVATDEDIPF